MASLTCRYFSFTLKSNTEIRVTIPTPEGNEQITNSRVTDHYRYEEGLPVVYLLHGAYGDNASWTRFSNIERYAQENCICTVMASAGNTFYQNMAHGERYFDFFTEELPGYVRSLFPVSKKREDTFVAGFSMGGYGAWYLGLKRPDLYAKAASMSGALDIAGLYESQKNSTEEYPFRWDNLFENPEKLSGSDRDLFELYRRCREKGTVPELYQACGTGDFLYGMNVKARDRMRSLGADITYEEGPGCHDWNFWDEHIQHILKWMLKK
jgi:putative tributyrin esterase